MTDLFKTLVYCTLIAIPVSALGTCSARRPPREAGLCRQEQREWITGCAQYQSVSECTDNAAQLFGCQR